MKLLNAALLAAASVPFVAALAPIVRKGSFLFDSQTGDRFYLKGLAYACGSFPSASPVQHLFLTWIARSKLW